MADQNIEKEDPEDECGLVIICQGPPICELKGDKAMKAQGNNGCGYCKTIWVLPDGREIKRDPCRYPH